MVEKIIIRGDRIENFLDFPGHGRLITVFLELVKIGLLKARASLKRDFS